MATHRHRTPYEVVSFTLGDDRTAEEAALHIEREPRAGSQPRPRRRRTAMPISERPPRHYGFADEEPEFGEHARYGEEDLVDSEELAVEERYAFEEDPDDAADEYPPELDDDR